MKKAGQEGWGCLLFASGTLALPKREVYPLFNLDGLPPISKYVNMDAAFTSCLRSHTFLLGVGDRTHRPLFIASLIVPGWSAVPASFLLLFFFKKKQDR